MSATNVRPPIGVSATLNEFETRKFTGGAVGAETTHHTDALPDASWSGKYVSALAIGGNCHYAFTRFPTAEVDRAVAATEAGALTKVGGVLMAGIKEHFRLPYWAAGSLLYFARESDTVGTVVYLSLSDEPGVKTNP